MVREREREIERVRESLLSVSKNQSILETVKARKREGEGGRETEGEKS